MKTNRSQQGRVLETVRINVRYLRLRKEFSFAPIIPRILGTSGANTCISKCIYKRKCGRWLTKQSRFMGVRVKVRVVARRARVR